VRAILFSLLLATFAILSAALVGAAHAADARPAADDPALEARMMAMAGELRCLVCQNETLAASHADLAVDLRNQIRDKMRAGESDDAIRAYLVARYGDFVLYNPPLKATTVVLWVGPFALLVLAAAALTVIVRRRARAPLPPLNKAEHQRAQALLRQAEQDR
jgi:cytochrome c-type biogenesis protein CcmH